MLGFDALGALPIGDAGSSGPTSVTGNGAATIEIVAAALGSHGVAGAGTAVIEIVAAATGRHARSIARGTAATWQGAAPNETTLTAPSGVAQRSERGVQAPWGDGQPVDDAAGVQWAVAAAHDQCRRAPWLRFTGVAEPKRSSRWAVAKPADDVAQAPWGRYTGRAQPEQIARWALSMALDEAAGAPWGGPMLAISPGTGVPFSTAAARDLTQWVPWTKFSRTLALGIGVSIPPDDGVPEALIVVPVRKVYMTVNVTHLRRVDGDVPLPTHGLSLNIDADSWVWSFSASMPADVLADVEPVDGEPVELEAYVNGATFRLLVERIQRDRQFGKSAISVSGRGKAALLSAPYAPSINFGNPGAARTIEQLMGDVLTLNGVPLGWDVASGLTDWLVPAGAFSMSGDYMGAINRLAQAGGGYVQAHRSLQALDILPKYPVAPWDWATLVDPDYELPAAPVTRESIEWVDKPRYNRVYVQGMAGGVNGRVTRAGTAGDMPAPTIVDALTTHADAARQRGLPVLADVGRIAYVGLRLPVLAETGVIAPGKFVRYVDGATTRIGIVRAVGLEVNTPSVWQTIRLETHHEPV